jgi:uncharacterized paraquat-inducible protein A
MARRIIIDGIKVEGPQAQQIIQEAMYDVDEAGKPRRALPLSQLVVVAIVVGIVTGVVGYLLTRYANGLSRKMYIAICIFVSFIVAAICSRFYWRTQRRQLRAAMRRHGFELCTHCGYWLKGLSPDQSRCPECGAARQAYCAGENGQS